MIDIKHYTLEQLQEFDKRGLIGVVRTMEGTIEMLRELEKEPWLCFEVETNMKHMTFVNYRGRLGAARCHPDDDFDLGSGIKIAFGRALQTARAEEKAPFIPATEEKYYVPAPTIRCKYTMRLWTNDARDQFLLQQGLVCRSRTDAVLIADRMLDVLKRG